MNPEQKIAFDNFTRGNGCIGLFGAGGTGKSFLIRKMVEYCKESKIVYTITAMTGVAADLLGGRTLHSALGLKLARGSVDTIAYGILYASNKQPLTLWRTLDVLFIDEISMMDSDLMDKLDGIGRSLRYNDSPFGGIRIVVSGDVLQLGPVPPRGQKEASYFFESIVWDEAFCNDNIFTLTTLVRQDRDLEWGNILSRIRLGKCSPDDLRKLAMQRKSTIVNDVDIIQIYSHNTDVDRINNTRLESLIRSGAKHVTFTCKIESTCPNVDAYSHLIKPDIKLCVGARVMHTINCNASKIYNGTMGKVVKIRDDGVTVEFSGGNIVDVCYNNVVNDVRYDNSVYTVIVTHVPLRLCWASTVHRVQGATLEEGKVNVSNAFAPGQVYTALSRFKTLKGIGLIGFEKSRIFASPKCLDFWDKITKY